MHARVRLVWMSMDVYLSLYFVGKRTVACIVVEASNKVPQQICERSRIWRYSYFFEDFNLWTVAKISGWVDTCEAKQLLTLAIVMMACSLPLMLFYVACIVIFVVGVVFCCWWCDVSTDLRGGVKQSEKDKQRNKRQLNVKCILDNYLLYIIMWKANIKYQNTEIGRKSGNSKWYFAFQTESSLNFTQEAIRRHEEEKL